ncbi:MAG: acyl-CoA dehydrogenase [Myxococcota bacterium]|nr:acyl-CoA dehydrogenase [Myxococcota bacterium]
MISQSDIDNFGRTAHDFAKRSLAPLFKGEHSDGDLEQLPDIYSTALEIGLASAADPSMDGNEFGVWGAITDQDGTAPSIVILEALAQVCGGVAMAVNAQGVASNIAMQGSFAPPISPVRAALCLQEGPFPPRLDAIHSPSAIETIAVPMGDAYQITGTKDFVYAMGDVDAYIVFVRVEQEWGCFLVPAGTSGIAVVSPGVRTGLRACTVQTVTFDDVLVKKAYRIDGAKASARALLYRALGLNWTGIAAIAVGIARGASAAARQYMSERYQGGMMIENHPALKMLVAGAEAKTETVISSMLKSDVTDVGSAAFYKRAASAKLMATTLCSEAVTDCLQTFGGYGYIEDFGMEKRLRDITTLKSACGSPFYLKQMMFDLSGE